MDSPSSSTSCEAGAGIMGVRGRLRSIVCELRADGERIPVHDRLRDRRIVTLTFDDGPSPRTTPELLALLRTFDVRASFFLTGSRAERHPALVDAIVQDGHRVFAHGYDHVRFETLSGTAIGDQLQRCEAVLSRHRPTPSPYLVRLPYGSGHRDPRVHRALRAWRPDCEIAHWSYSLDDFALADGCANERDLRLSCSAAVTRTLRYARLPGAILLLHEDPFDIAAPLAPQVTPILVRDLLARLLCAGFAIGDTIETRDTAAAAPARPKRAVAPRHQPQREAAGALA